MNSNQLQLKVKTWWGAVWRGLVVDSAAKHYKAMRSAIWLYLYLVIHADRKTGTLNRRYQTIAQDTGIPLRTIRHWLSILRSQGYIQVRRSGQSLAISIQIHKWKPLATRSSKL